MMRLRIPTPLLLTIGVTCWLGAFLFLTYPHVFVERFAYVLPILVDQGTETPVAPAYTQSSTSPRKTEAVDTSDKILEVVKQEASKPVLHIVQDANSDAPLVGQSTQLKTREEQQDATEDVTLSHLLAKPIRTETSLTERAETKGTDSKIDDQAEKFLVRQSIGKWQAAWQAQDATAYVAQYVEGFQFSKDHFHQAWLTGRIEKLTQPRKVKIEIVTLLLKRIDTHRWEFTFLQLYNSDVYNDVTTKKLVLIKVGDEYLIEKEKFL